MKHIAKIFCLLLALVLLAGCGRTAAPTNEPTTGMPNPQKESSEIEILTRFGTVMSLPQGGLVDDYFIIEGENSVAEMRFSLKDSNYVARFMPAAEYEDISGMHYEWQHTETANDLYNTTLRYNDGAQGVIDLYDANLGLICSLSTDSGADPDTLRSVAKEVFAPVTDGFGSSRVDGLNALLDDVREHYFPGTAGSSLSGAACAAKLADYFAETGIDPDSVSAAVTTYASALEDEERVLFEQQLDGVVSSFTAITAEGGEGILADCGYEAARYPWTEENVSDCFVAMLGSD
ncbi:MAG: hypothetical protein IIZ83_05885 [Oscillospiraceae bacterium]|nr:hypothetical protein [Oscillospiraceae bacterium]